MICFYRIRTRRAAGTYRKGISDMKKLIILLTVLALICVSLFSCGDNEEETSVTEVESITETESETETETEPYDTDFDKYDTDENWTPYL